MKMFTKQKNKSFFHSTVKKQKFLENHLKMWKEICTELIKNRLNKDLYKTSMTTFILEEG